jgi:hypothetical protein
MATPEICNDEQRRHFIRKPTRQVSGLKANGIDYVEFIEHELSLKVYFLGKIPAHIKAANVLIEGGRHVTDIVVTHVSSDENNCVNLKINKRGDNSLYKLYLVEVDKNSHPLFAHGSHGQKHYHALDGIDPQFSAIDFLFKTPINGIDYVEIGDDQKSLSVFFLRKAPAHIRKENVRIEGGRRITYLQVLGIEICRTEEDDRDDCMRILLDKCGDFSTYRLCLIEVNEKGEPVFDTDKQDHKHYRPMPGFDPRYACAEFSFRESGPTDLDCALEPECPLEPLEEPEIDYLARDYASFRQLILDRLALIMPDWQERHVPDLGITLVELLAYVGDHLSYYQDAVATEAYLDTARQRISVRRHARLVDYFLHEGCNARAWVYIETSADKVTLKRDELSFITGRRDEVPFRNTLLAPEDLHGISRELYEVFEPVVPMVHEEIHLHQAHNTIRFYTWGNRECCLPKGATSATLRDEWVEVQTSVDEHQQSEQVSKSGEQKTATSSTDREHILDHLQISDVLIFEEVRDPRIGTSADANPLHRHAIRLTNLTRMVDELYDQPVIEIEWALEDALPFPLCLSAITDAPDCKYLEDISIAHGNVVLVDHGRTLGRIDLDEKQFEDLDEVPLLKTIPPCEEVPCPAEVETLAAPYRPFLKQTNLTYAQPIAQGISASYALKQDPHKAVPVVKLQGNPPGRESYKDWSVQFDLFNSQAEDYHYVIEVDNDGCAHLRFGDGELGRTPQAGTKFRASYRVGNGPAGNVGAETIKYLVISHTRYSGLSFTPCNPLPASGGTLPQLIDEAKLYAPFAFRKELKRAITADDYAQLAQNVDPNRIQRAAGILRWTGSWYEAMVSIDLMGTVEQDADLSKQVDEAMQAYRRIGHDLVVKPVQYVPLEIELTVCVLPNYLAGHVKAELLDVLSNRRLRDRRLGFFHPDNLTCGEDVYLSRLIAAARSIMGIENVVANIFKRFMELPNREIENGLIPIGPLEVARLDNDPNFPENGVLKLTMVGGR